MDDEEYYRTMRNQYSFRFQKKARGFSRFSAEASRQGKEDAEMLEEKRMDDEITAADEEKLF